MNRSARPCAGHAPAVGALPSEHAVAHAPVSASGTCPFAHVFGAFGVTPGMGNGSAPHGELPVVAGGGAVGFVVLCGGGFDPNLEQVRMLCQRLIFDSHARKQEAGAM